MSGGEEKNVKAQPARKAGPAPARPAQPRRAKAQGAARQAHPPAVGRVANPPHELREPLKPEVRPVPTDDVEELFAPHESDALLSGLEQDRAAEVPPAPGGDDVWERLARTGWLRKQAGVIQPEGRAAQRPSA